MPWSASSRASSSGSSGWSGTRPPTSTSHQHVHRDMPARRALRRAGERLGVPVRHFTPEITYSAVFFGQDGKGNPFPEAITVEALVSVIEGLPPGITELACHPAAAAEGASVYDEERVDEVNSLCDPRVRDAIARRRIALRSVRDHQAGGGRLIAALLVALLALFAFGCGEESDEPAAKSADAVIDANRLTVAATGDIGMERTGAATLEAMGEADADLTSASVTTATPGLAPSRSSVSSSTRASARRRRSRSSRETTRRTPARTGGSPSLRSACRTAPGRRGGTGPSTTSTSATSPASS